MIKLKFLKGTILASLALLTACSGCKRHSSTGNTRYEVKIPSSAAEPDPVRFGIQELSRQEQGDGQEITWLATYQSKSGDARFKISLILPKPGGKLFEFSHGALISDGSSEYSEFLRQVAHALQADKIEAGEPRTDRLDFEVAILGQNVENRRDSTEGAGSTGGADWTMTKVFVAGDDGEFYLNLNPKAGIGEIAIKDSDYGDIVVKELSRVFHAKDSLPNKSTSPPRDKTPRADPSRRSPPAWQAPAGATAGRRDWHALRRVGALGHA
jgi:hypothetical protein